MIKVKPKLDYIISIGDKSYLLDYKRYDLLNLIEKNGSMVKASKITGLSYRTILNYISQIEDSLDISVVDTKKGGAGGGGGTILSKEGKALIDECDKVKAIVETHADFNELRGKISRINKNSGIMEFKVNSNIKLILSYDTDYSVGDDALALISNDNVIISLESKKSSARNNFKGKIVEMGIEDNMIRIKIDIGGICIYSDITLFAQKDLNLELGNEVYISFKAVSVAIVKL